MCQESIDLQPEMGLYVQRPVYDTAGDLHHFELDLVEPDQVPEHVGLILDEQAPVVSEALAGGQEAEHRWTDKATSRVFVIKPIG